ncbi:MAG: glycosyltransferase family 1 protein [Chloroflexi bacterium]|nr:MAG: glycosyltransferase family 1 protein [Chloroflexota bacterium]
MTSAKLFIASGIFHPESGGPATYLYEVLPHLQQAGWDVRLLTYGDGDVATYPYPVTRIARGTLPLRLARYAQAARPLLRWADVVYQHTLGLPLWMGAKRPRVVKIVGDQAWERAVRRKWIPPTTDIDVFQHGGYGLRATFARAARAREVRSMAGVIVPSAYLRQMVIGWGVAPEKVHVIYNALPTTSLPGITQQQARTQLNLPDAPTLLTAARLVQWKGIDHIITALQQVAEVRLLIAGNGPMRDSLLRQTQALRLTDRITFLGHVSREDMPLYMKAADYVALYSGYEGLSHTLLESLRVGTPVIASDKGGNPEVVQHNINGLLVPYIDTDALIATLHEAFQPGKRDSLAANTHIGMERFDFDAMIQSTHEFLSAYLHE